MNELVSVIVTAHNSSNTLGKTLSSIDNQTYEYMEVIIIDDFSTDDTRQVIFDFKRRSKYAVKLIFNSENYGVAKSRNIAISKAKGTYLAFLDSDDVWMPRKVEDQLSEMRRRNIKFSFTNYFTMDVNGNTLAKRVMSPGEYRLKDFLKGNPAGLLTVMIQNSHEFVDLFPSIQHEDYAAWIKVVKKFKSATLLEQSNAKYRIHNSLSSNKLKSFFWTAKILKVYGRLNLFQLSIAMVHYVNRVFKRKRKV